MMVKSGFIPSVLGKMKIISQTNSLHSIVNRKVIFDDEALRGLAKDGIILSEEQEGHIKHIVNNGVSVLTGGPGTGKSFTTKSLVMALEYINKKVLLCAPTGKAAKRLSEVTGKEAKTIHRTLVWDPVNFGFEHGEGQPASMRLLGCG